jgi:predicted metal-dependent hydrolase
MLDWTCAGLAGGLACYRAAQFFEAHEHWEGVWLTLQEPEKSFLQSLIQITAAFHHLQEGNKTGAVSLLRRAFNRLSHCPAEFGGIEVASLREEVAEWLLRINNGAALDIAGCPRIRLVGARLD